MSQQPTKYRLAVHPSSFAICRLAPDRPLPDWALESRWFAITRTASELSVVCPESVVPVAVTAELGWRWLSVEGCLEISLVGVIAGLTETLARAGISVLVLSSFDTDHLLIRSDDLPAATRALLAAGYGILEEA